MSPDLQALRDIHDSLGHPWWPLAPGWWLTGLALITAFALFRRYRLLTVLLPTVPMIRLGDWRWDALHQLRSLRRKPKSVTDKERLAALAELLKRIAMARHGRSACAGLHGEAWLEWLSLHDPDGFDWRQQAQALIRAPYAPEQAMSTHPPAGADESIRRDQLERLIVATERWILVRPKPRPGSRKGAEAPSSIAARALRMIKRARVGGGAAQ